MKKNIACSFTLVLSFAAILSAHAADSSAVSPTGNATKGKILYMICSTCHGANGEGNLAFHAPVIGGQELWYLERQLQNFKAGTRGSNPADLYGAQMRPMAMTLTSDQAIADVAAYVTSLKPTTPARTIKGDAAVGKAGFALCLACHGVRGEGNVAFNAPRLTGQHDWYVVQQLTNFKSGLRGAKAEDTFGMQMRPMAMTLVNEAAIRNMAAYVSTLR